MFQLIRFIYNPGSLNGILGLQPYLPDISLAPHFSFIPKTFLILFFAFRMVSASSSLHDGHMSDVQV